MPLNSIGSAPRTALARTKDDVQAATIGEEYAVVLLASFVGQKRHRSLRGPICALDGFRA